MKFRIEHIAILILAGIVLYLRMCSGAKCPPAQEIVKHFRDTVIVHHQDTVDHYVPKITTVSRPITIYRTDSLYIIQPIDTQEVLKDYFATRYYSDTRQTQYGDITIQDSVRENRIIDRRLLTDFKIPVIHDSTIAAEPKRNQLYIGGGLLGSTKELITGFEADLTLKNKKDQQYYIGGSILTTGVYYFRLGTRFKLSFRK
jgi:hypothetical protein